MKFIAYCDGKWSVKHCHLLIQAVHKAYALNLSRDVFRSKMCRYSRGTGWVLEG